MSLNLFTSYRKSVCLFLLIAPVMAIYAPPVVADTLAGVVVSADDRPVSGALVAVTDNATGMVIMEMSNQSQGPHFTSTLTDSSGRFALEVPPGNYNVLAQYWENHEVAWQSQGMFGQWETFGDSVSAAGTASGISVPSPQAENLRIAPAGKAFVEVEVESGNDDAIVVISKAPPLDPVFGLAGWIGDFATSAVAMNRAPNGSAQFHMLPAGTLYVAVFGNDSRPSFGVAEVQVADMVTTSVKVEWVGPWSNARKTPPERLQQLYDKAVSNGWNMSHFPDVPRAALSRNRPDLKAFKKLVQQRDKMVSLPDGSKASLMDIATVMAYRVLAAEVENFAKMTKERER